MAIPVAVGRAAGSAVGQVAIQIALEKAFFNKDVKDTVKNTESAFSKGFGGIEKTSGKVFSGIGGIIKTAFAVVGVGAVTQFAKEAVNAASETQSAWTGLNSILTGTGKSFAEGKEFIDEYISDGLIPLGNAVTAYKNLASRGYSTEQIESTMLALKDAAAFGRQASYSYGDAITSATEGLKNENSILVDNAGVTKNVAKMWDEYAASIGTTANNLTQQQKIQAEVNGIIAETKFQTGDAAAYANTFAGKVARINTAFSNFKVAVGKFIAPIAELFLPYIEMALNALTRFFNKLGQVLKVFGLEMPDVVSKTSTSIADMGSSAIGTADNIASTGSAAEKAAKKIKRAFAGVDEINVLNMPDNSKKSSGGSGGAGAIGGGSVTDTTGIGDVTETIDSGASKIANKLKELFEPLTKIDFSNLTNAFDRLKKSLEPLTEKLFDGLEWLWENILVPFAKWTIEDYMPTFFNALAGALDFFNGVIDYAKPYLLFLWEDFLQPIAKWTGGVIVDTLGWIGDKLSAIGKWLSGNTTSTKKIREELEPFTNLLSKLGEYLGAIYDRLKPTIDLFVGNLKNSWENILKPMLEFLFKQIWTSLKATAGVLGGILDVLIGIVSLDFGKVKEGLEGIWKTIKKSFLDTVDNWKTLGSDLINGLVNGIETAFGNVKEWVKKAIFDPVTKGFKSLFGINSPSKVFAEYGKYFIQGLANGLIAAKDYLVKKWNTVKGWFTNITKEAKVEIKQKWSDIKSKWTNLTTNIKNKTAEMKAKISTTWSDLKSKWNSLMSNFKDKTITIKAKVGEVVGSFKETINDKLIKPLNKKLPSIFPKIPYLAQGGWLAKNNPTLAVVGDNKHEPEIVAPESKIRDQVVKGIQEAGGTNNQHFDFTIKLEYPDGKYLIKEINNTQIKDGKISLLV